MELSAPVKASAIPSRDTETNDKAEDHRSDPHAFPASPSFEEHRKREYNYASLADQIGPQPGLAIYRRFAALNAKNLLYLQAEIAELEEQLAEQEAYDQDQPQRREFQWMARELMNAPPGEDKQWQKVLELRAKLKEYNSLLLQQAQLHKLPSPNPYDLTYLRDWVWRPDYGNRFLYPPEYVWDPAYAADLVALSRRDKEGDIFSRWFSSSLWPFIHRNILHPPEDRTVGTVVRDTGARLRRGSTQLWRLPLHSAHGAVTWLRRRRRRRPPPPHSGASADDDAEAPHPRPLARTGTVKVARTTAEGSVVYKYGDEALNRAVEVVSILVSSLLPTISIVVLNYIPAEPAIRRLGFILGFSAFFTLCLALFTEARRIEIFAAAVALASVQVVFIGSQGGEVAAAAAAAAADVLPAGS